MRNIYSYLIFSLIFLVLRTSSAEGEVLPQTNSSSSIQQATISISAESIPKEISHEKTTEYTLPYPGMLPDSPFYFLKVFRDKVISFLISDPLKKAEFNLLQADKRLQTGVFLVEKDKTKTSLAISTISKGQNYFGEAIDKVQEAKKQGEDASDILDRLITSSRKHQEVLRNLEKNVGKEAEGDIAAMQKRMEEFEKSAMKIKQ